jgi:hypothetical protein
LVKKKPSDEILIPWLRRPPSVKGVLNRFNSIPIQAPPYPREDKGGMRISWE